MRIISTTNGITTNQFSMLQRMNIARLLPKISNASNAIGGIRSSIMPRSLEILQKTAHYFNANYESTQHLFMITPTVNKMIV